MMHDRTAPSTVRVDWRSFDTEGFHKVSPIAGPFRRRLSSLFRRIRTDETATVLSAVFIYGAAFSVFTILKLYTLQASAWDLGNYNQAMYTFVFENKLFYWTADIVHNPSGSLFGVHVSPVLALLAPIYILLPRPETLLVIHSFAIGAGALPVWLLAKNVLHLEPAGFRLTLVIAYLVQPALWGVNQYDFHPEAFIPVFYLFAAYYLLKKEYLRATASSLLLLSTIEYAALLLITLVISLAYPYASSFFKNNDGRQSRDLTALFGLGTLSLAWLFTSLYVIRTLSPTDPTTGGLSPQWAVLGADNLLQVPFRVLVSPIQAASALLYDAPQKLFFLILFAIPFALLPLFSLRFWLLSSPWLVPALLSSYPAYYQVGLQYPSFIIPPLVFVYLTQFANRRPWAGRWARAIFATLGRWKLLKLPNVTVSPSTTLKACTVVALLLLGFYASTLASSAFVTSPLRSTSANDLLSLIPSRASVLTNHYIFPLVSSRINAFTWPYVINYPTIPIVTYLQQLVNQSDFVLLDLTLFRPYNAIILSHARGNFGVLGFADGFLLLQRSYSGEPLLFRQHQERFAPNELRPLGGRIVVDPDSSTDSAITRPTNAISTTVWDGPGVELPPGEYRITFELKLNTATLGHVLTLTASVRRETVRQNLLMAGKAISQSLEASYETSNETIAKLQVDGSMLQVGSYSNVSMNVRADAWGLFDFSGRNVTQTVGISLAVIEITEISPLAYFDRVAFEDANGLVVFL